MRFLLSLFYPGVFVGPAGAGQLEIKGCPEPLSFGAAVAHKGADGRAERLSKGRYLLILSRRKREYKGGKKGARPKRCLPIRKHREAREKRYSFGYAVFLILALMK